MTRWGFHAGKLLLLVLAVTSSILLFTSYRKVAALTEQDAELRAALSTERLQIARRVLVRYFQDNQTATQAVIRRQRPDRPLQGVPPLPDETLQILWSHLRTLAEQTHTNPAATGTGKTKVGHQAVEPIPTEPRDPVLQDRFLDLLYDQGTFFSGMPKRYAGLIEILRYRTSALPDTHRRRVETVFRQFWQAEDIGDDDYGFLLNRLPQIFQRHFHLQRLFLALPAAEPMRSSYIRLDRDDQALLFKISAADLAELNRQAAALGSDLRFRQTGVWTHWQGIHFTLTPEPIPATDRLADTRLDYLLMGGALWLLLLTMSALLHKYEKVNFAQKQLLTATSHELRTPLAVMRQFAEMLLDKSPQFDNRIQTYHGYIHRECLRMQFLVENLLSAARVERLSLVADPHDFALRPWLAALCADYRKIHEGQVVDVDAVEVTVAWDDALLRQLVINLLENGRIHGGTALQVTAKLRGHHIELAVRDFGPGGDLRKLRRVRAFRTGGKAGMGLGLYLCHRIAQAHGGKLRFTHAHPGLRVDLLLPCRVDESTDTNPAKQADSHPPSGADHDTSHH